MGSGTATIIFDDDQLTALANYAIAKAEVDLPGPLPTTRVPVPHVVVTTHAGGNVVLKAGALPAVEVEPQIDAAGQVNFKVNVGPLGFPDLINDAIERPVNRQIAEMRAKLAEQGLELQLIRIETRTGELAVTATLTPTS